MLVTTGKPFATILGMACYLLLPSAAADTDNSRGWTLYPPESSSTHLTDQSRAIIARQSCLLDLGNAERSIANELLGVNYAITIHADPVWSYHDTGCSVTAKRTVDYEEQPSLNMTQAFDGSDRFRELLETGELLQAWVIYDPCEAAMVAPAAAAQILAYYEYTIEIEAFPDGDDAHGSGCKVITNRSVAMENE